MKRPDDDATGVDEANPERVVLDLLLGRWRSQALYAGTALRIFDAATSDPMPAAEIARKLTLDGPLSYRLMRALASMGLLEEHAGPVFALTAAGDCLRSDHPRSLRDLVLIRESPEHTAVWKHLPAIVRDGKQDGFVREFGAAAFEYATTHPTYAETFDRGMSSHSRLQTEWVLEALRDYDFASLRTLCDVGGGQGHLLANLVARHPHLDGIVFDRPSVVEQAQGLWAEKLRVGDRCRYLAGDMFADVPPADAYIMKMILHDWNDDECVRILANLNRRAPREGHVLIVERLLPRSGSGEFAALFDIHMMCWGTGRERTEQEYADLLGRSGWKHSRSWFPSGGIIGIVEGTKNA